MSKAIITKINEALDSIRPYLQTDGGDVEFVELTDDMTVKVRLTGSCETCSMSFFTMKSGIEESIKKAAPQVKSVEAINVEISKS